MRAWTKLLAPLVLAAACAAHAQELPLTIDPLSEEGELLLQIDEETEEPKRFDLLEKFAAKFPAHEAAAWVLVQLQAAYISRSEFDEALEAGARLIALVPDSLEAAHNCLRAAEAKKDPTLIRKWAVHTWEVSRRVASSAKPAGDEAETWKQTIDYAKSLHSYSEYSLYAAAVTAGDPKTRIELLSELEQRNSRSPYLAQVHSQYYMAFRQLGNLEQSVALAESNAKQGKADEDMLTLLTVYSYQRKDMPKTLFYASQVIEMIANRKPPEDLKPDQWEEKKQLALGNAYYLTGIIMSDQERHAEADRALRAALPHLKFDEYIRASALFHLGWANYKMGELAQSPGLIKEAIRFNSLCAAIPTPFRTQAMKNVEAIKLEYDLK